MAYTPKRGDVVNIDLSPQVGHEQAGHRPALVMSANTYNNQVGLAIACPITNKSKGYPFEVTIPVGIGVTGVVIADQAKSVDWQGRGATFRCRMPDDVLDEVFQQVVALIEAS